MPIPPPPGPGRPKGLPNKATQQAREAIGRFVDGNSHRLQEWLDRIAEESPEKAFTLFQSVIEYHVPKLARTEIRNPDGEEFKIKHIDISDKEILERYMESKK